MTQPAVKPKSEPLSRLDTSLMEFLLQGMKAADSQWKPTNFWQPAIDRLADSFRKSGMDKFRSISDGGMYIPRYGQNYTMEMADEIWELVQKHAPKATRPWLNQQLLGAAQAHKDMDIAMAAWNHRSWPMDFQKACMWFDKDLGQSFRLFPDCPSRYDRAHLNYLMIFSVLSKYLTSAPLNVLELGGGYGAVGTLLANQKGFGTYINVDIPPVLAVSTHYLSASLGADKVLDGSQSADMQVVSPEALRERKMTAAAIPTWHLPKVSGEFDVFVNSYSFQEMEPPTVRNYARYIAEIGPRFIVSLNSVKGKTSHKSVGADSWTGGVIEPVNNQMVADSFKKLGYQQKCVVGRPFAPVQASVLIMEKRGWNTTLSTGWDLLRPYLPGRRS